MTCSLMSIKGIFLSVLHVQLCIVDVTYCMQFHQANIAMYYICSYSDSVNEKVTKYCTDHTGQKVKFFKCMIDGG